MIMVKRKRLTRKGNNIRKNRMAGVDVTPTWQGLVPSLVALIERGDYKGRKVAVDEFNKIAKLADEVIRLKKQGKLKELKVKV